MGEFLNNLTGDQKTQLAFQAAKIVPAIIGFNAAAKAKQRQDQYILDLEEAEKNRQRLVNPYANISNPYANLQVATKAAEMQAEQTDLALANTLDNLRQTGAGGATALAQAALRSKQGVSATIQQQEAQNSRLAAQGQLQVDIYRARGEENIQKMQEERELTQLDRLQGLIDQEFINRQQGLAAGVGAVGSMIEGGAQALIKPKATEPTIEEQMAADKNKSISLTPRSGVNVSTTSNAPSANLTLQNVNTTIPNRGMQRVPTPNTQRGLQGIGSPYYGVPSTGVEGLPITSGVNLNPLAQFMPIQNTNNPFNAPNVSDFDMIGNTQYNPLIGLTTN